MVIHLIHSILIKIQSLCLTDYKLRPLVNWFLHTHAWMLIGYQSYCSSPILVDQTMFNWRLLVVHAMGCNLMIFSTNLIYAKNTKVNFLSPRNMLILIYFNHWCIPSLILSCTWINVFFLGEKSQKSETICKCTNVTLYITLCQNYKIAQMLPNFQMISLHFGWMFLLWMNKWMNVPILD
jgi:hypothetical protein